MGGGSAGSVVANRLSENNRVLLLEAGGEPHPLQQIPLLSFMMLNRPGIDWNYYTVPQSKSCLGMYNNVGCNRLLNFKSADVLTYGFSLPNSNALGQEPRDLEVAATTTFSFTCGVIPTISTTGQMLLETLDGGTKMFSSITKSLKTTLETGQMVC